MLSWVKSQELFEYCSYNSTVLAYGQTGSGKTFTIGTGHSSTIHPSDAGVIPRVIGLIFEEIEKRKKKAEFIIRVSFLEIHNEEIHDLLDPSISHSSSGGFLTQSLAQKKNISIREEKGGIISVYGLHEEVVKNSEELANCLDKGSVYRTTSSTLMNATSSRSHAIFSVTIEQHILEGLYGQEKPADNQEQAQEFMTAKFHFVDLAGSERVKKTGAVGDQMKEGININKGLLALGNVISALTDESKKTFHVPYRDSKLTRILQDSLGGNSRTSFIACISPSDMNFEETLGTLKYASRARNIKNKPVINRDPNSAQIAQLRQEVFELQRQMAKYKKQMNEAGIIPSPQKPPVSENSNSAEVHYKIGSNVEVLDREIYTLQRENKEKTTLISKQSSEIAELKTEKTKLEIDLRGILREKDILVIKLKKVKEENKKLICSKSSTPSKSRAERVIKSERNSPNKKEIITIDTESEEELEEIQVLDQYANKIETLTTQLREQEQKNKVLNQEFDHLANNYKIDNDLLEKKSVEMEKLKRLLIKTQKDNKKLKTGHGITGKKRELERQKSLPDDKDPRNTGKARTRVLSGNEKNNSETNLNEKWLPDEIEKNVENFNELFINNLTVSINNIITEKSKQDVTLNFMKANTSKISHDFESFPWKSPESSTAKEQDSPPIDESTEAQSSEFSQSEKS